jgi:hypothetical protein
VGLSRAEFFARIGLLRRIDPLTELAYRFEEQRTATQSDQGASAEDKWHVSFHGSQFPGDDPHACGRKSLYRMLDIPRSTGSYMFSNRKLTQIADAGKDIENRLVWRWHQAGFLLSTPPYDPEGRPQMQDVFEDEDAWLTSTIDASVLWPRTDTPEICEVKSKYADVIQAMRELRRGPDEQHVRQLKTQTAMVRHEMELNPVIVKRCHNTDRLAIPVMLSPQEYAKRYQNGHGKVQVLCAQHRTDRCLYETKLKPPDHGFIYYVSRDNPVDTWEFYYEYDPAFYDAGVAKLAEWRKHFIDGILPQTNFAAKRYAHPFGWLWGDQPCKFCDFGDVCRLDMKAALEKGEPLSFAESAAVEQAHDLRPEYDLDLVRTAVLDRWSDT